MTSRNRKEYEVATATTPGCERCWAGSRGSPWRTDCRELIAGSRTDCGRRGAFAYPRGSRRPVSKRAALRGARVWFYVLGPVDSAGGEGGVTARGRWTARAGDVTLLP